MNVSQYGSVVWRFRYLITAGVLLAFLLAGLSMVRVSSDGIQYRDQELWKSAGTLLITQSGFPEGRALFPPEPLPAPGEKPKTYPYAGIGRFTSLVDLYAQLANSDAVKKLMLRDGPLLGTVQAAAIPPSVQGGASPLLAIVGTGPAPEAATTMVERGTEALRTYVSQEADRAGIPAEERVEVQVLKRTDAPVLVEGRKKTLPIVVFLAVLSTTFGLAFVLENARPAVRPVPTAIDDVTEARRSA